MTAFGIKYSVSNEDSIIAKLMAIYVVLVPAFSILMNWTCKSSTAFLVRSKAFLKLVPKADLIGYIFASRGMATPVNTPSEITIQLN